MPIYISALSGFLGGGTAVLVSMPFDVIKTRKQVYEQYLAIPSVRLMRQIVGMEGVKALYTGITARLLSSSIYGALLLSLYDKISHLMQKMIV